MASSCGGWGRRHEHRPWGITVKLRHCVIGGALLWGLSWASESDAQWARHLQLPQLRSYYESEFADYHKPPLSEALTVTWHWLAAMPSRVSTLLAARREQVETELPTDELYNPEDGLNVPALGAAVLKLRGEEVPEGLEQIQNPDWAHELLRGGGASSAAPQQEGQEAQR